VADPLSGYFAVRRSVVEGVTLQPRGYKILLEILVRGNVTAVVEVPYRFEARGAGTSKLTARQHWEYLRYLWSLRRVPAAGRMRRCVAGPAGILEPGVQADRARAAAERRREFVRHLKAGPVPQLQVAASTNGGVPPRVSVIIPSADGTRDHHLTRLLKQIQEQPFQSLEVIVVKGDRRQGRAINTAAAMARGSLLITMDDDTVLGDTGVIQKLVAAFDKDPTIGIAGVSNRVPDDAPAIVRRAMRELPRRSSAIVQSVTDSDMVEHPCLAIRRDLFMRIGGEHEQIPRGLDPYLRREVRRHGYRVVVIPNAWVHHMLPSTFRGMLRQYFRNGLGAAYVQKWYPVFVIEQAETHDEEARPQTSLPRRAARYIARLGSAVGQARWIYLGTLMTYAAGYLWGLLTLREDSL
jgi:hypothetical protein